MYLLMGLDIRIFQMTLFLVLIGLTVMLPFYGRKDQTAKGIKWLITGNCLALVLIGLGMAGVYQHHGGGLVMWLLLAIVVNGLFFIRRAFILSAELVEINHRDRLTMTYNKAYLMIKLEEMRALLQRKHLPFMMSIVSVNNLDQIRKKYGEDAADTVLRDLAKYMEDQLRRIDVITRYSHDAFGIVLRVETVEEGKYVLDRLVDGVHDIKWTVSDIQVELCGGATLVGEPEKLMTADAIIEIAEKRNFYAIANQLGGIVYSAGIVEYTF